MTAKQKGKSKVGLNYRNEAQILKDRAEIARRLLQGQSILEMAKEMNMGYQLVQYDIRCVNKLWTETADHDIVLLKQKQLEKLDLLESTYWEAWERSVQGRKKTSEVGEADGKGKYKVLRGATMKEETFGDPRYLQGVHQCIMSRCRLLGMIEESRGNKSEDDVPKSQNLARFIILPAPDAPRAIPIQSSVKAA